MHERQLANQRASTDLAHLPSSAGPWAGSWLTLCPCSQALPFDSDLVAGRRLDVVKRSGACSCGGIEIEELAQYPSWGCCCCLFGFSPYEQELLSVSILQVTLLKAMPDIILLLRRSSSHSLLWMKLHSSMRRKAPPLLREVEEGGHQILSC